MAVFNVHEAKARLSRLLDRVAEGEEIVIAKSGKPVAKLVRLPAEPRKLGRLMGRIHIGPEFDEPLPAATPSGLSGAGRRRVSPAHTQGAAVGRFAASRVFRGPTQRLAPANRRLTMKTGPNRHIVATPGVMGGKPRIAGASDQRPRCCHLARADGEKRRRDCN